MEQWQFLIQKEGERTWHPLMKPRVQVIEGRYRVVARCNRTNTDVEVRVTHSFSKELPPVPIQKRRRRTNSEGLTAIIPFTYLKSGIWELQCSGDFMSDLLGGSWQYTVSLAVVPSPVYGKTISPKNSSQNLNEQYKVSPDGMQKNQAASKIKNVQSSPSSPSSKDLKTNDAGLISSISVEAVKSKSRNTNARQLISTSAKSVKADKDRAAREKPAEKLRESLKAASDKQKTVRKTATQKLQDSIKVTPQKATSGSSVAKPVKKPKPPLKSSAAQNKVVSEKSAHKESVAIIEQTASPVRVKGDTAEQILQNLIELALPSSSTLLPDEAIEEIPIAPPPLPLLLTLDKANYVARWGESISLHGEVQIKETTSEQIKQITHTEVRIELQSPQNSQLLQSARQTNQNKTLPFAIASDIEIPQECSSKLILGEVKVYGALSSNGVVELLASESFTITADITELLPITVANPRGELDTFGYSTDELSAIDNPPEILEPAVSLDLELFNLVNTAKPEQSVIGVPSTKKSLPPRIDPRRFRQRVGAHSPKLPNVPGYQEKIDEYINNQRYLRDSTITGTSFPYLRKLEVSPNSSVEVKSDVSEVEESTYELVAETQNIAETLAQVDNGNLAELVVDEQKVDNYFEFEEPVKPRSSEFIAGQNSNTSPLIRKWMLSQGYSLPEPIDVEYEDYEIEPPEEISRQQGLLNPNIKTNDNSQALDEEKALKVSTSVPSTINIQGTPYPYFSISSTSGWQINQTVTPSTQIAQEIVVDDTDIVADRILVAESSEKDQPAYEPIKKLSDLALTISTQKIEQLPIPQLYLPQGKLIAGKSVNLRVRLLDANSDLAVKLWLEDCQTRHLLDGPHLVTNLTPNKNGELEVITKLNIPFGCLEIRLEAIAINRTTQQESHKFTIQRTVIPPDLPNIQFDAILGM